jgi:multidrug resistance protein, MATE family
MLQTPAVLPVTHRSILAVAIPIMLSNVTEPMIGVVNTAVIGRLEQAYYIGAIAVGSLIFSFVFWGFGFLRLSTGGYSAQAVGAGDRDELMAVLGRALAIAAVAGAVLVILSPVVEWAAFGVMGGSEDVQRFGRAYFRIRIWSAPFAFFNFAFMGWFIGQGKTAVTFILQLFLNAVNMALSALFVLRFGMTVDGVGYAALIAEASAAVLGAIVVWRWLQKSGSPIPWSLMRDGQKFLATMKSNTDIMIRTLCLVFAFGWFVSRGARAGDVIVAANAILLNFFEVAAYLIDGFAYASEAFVGQAIGGRDRPRFVRAIKLTTVWAVIVGAICSLLIWFQGPAFIALMTVNPDVQSAAKQYLYLASLTPVLGAICFQLDGIFTGAMATREMRNMMILSLMIYLGAWAFLEPRYANHGLWAALCIFFAARGLTFGFVMPKIARGKFP